MQSNTALLIMSKDNLKDLVDEIFDKLVQRLDSSNNTHLKAKDELLTRKETRDILKISYPTLHSWTKKKVIKATKIQRRVYYTRAEIQRFIST